MKYFIDTEFLEGTQRKTLFGIPTLGLRWDETGHLEIFKPQTKNTIDLISIGIVSEKGREYYAISKDFNLKEAWNRYEWKDFHSAHGEKLQQKVYWIRENVLKPIFNEWKAEANVQIKRLGLPIHLKEMEFNFKNFKHCIKCIGKSNKEIAYRLESFIRDDFNQASDYENPIQFYAYYADYDWVAFCWLFGKMMDLPTGFPIYCIDLKQELESILENNTNTLCDKHIYKDNIKLHPNYPKQKNEHNALADAKWNKRLYEFLNTL